ncbi:L,D-transpeptidase family protein [Hyphomicrobium sp. CS1GBMeth3]|uniref:L,D-transpeptidase family protein n=1 Tax=Hyphomicrobium sp. CS1GBMeth3 TaxID=1892845 RepID=UPI000930560B|nr:L,D-transpeptidase family protein [Hyphomicrobium sp. CS1GBMeth3]
MPTTTFKCLASATASVVVLAATASGLAAQTATPPTGTSPVETTGAIPDKPATPAATPSTEAQPKTETPAAPAQQDAKPAEKTPADAVANAVTPTPPANNAETKSEPAKQEPAAGAGAAAPAPAPAADSAASSAPDAGATPPAAAAAQPPAAPPVDPVIGAVRTWLGNSANAGKAYKDDAAAAVAFYGARTEGPIWVEASGFSTKATRTMDEIRKADEWGLSAAAFDLPTLGASPATEALAEAEGRLTLEFLKYVRHARGGRVNLASLSRILDQAPPIKDPNTVLTELAATWAPDAYLRNQHPKHPQFQYLHKALITARGASRSPVEIDPAMTINLPATREMLKVGVKHPNIALLRKRVKVPAEPGAEETLFDEKLALALKAFQASNGLEESGELTGATRKALNREVEALRPAADPDRSTQLLVMNMERWRWMPEDLGKVYVTNNIPEYMTRVTKGEEILFEERIIVGLPNWATPVFSETMKTIVFNPSWGMPDGIKQRELAPRLRSAGGGDFFSQLFGGGGGGGAAIRAHGLKVYYGGREINPDSVNWSTADLRAYSFIQPPGGSNPLGRVKFMFPNRHDVYMHDTIERSLFGQSSRALSHGCIRVQDPMQFAAVLLAEGNGLDPAAVENTIARGGEVKLQNPIPVHITYFTAVADKSGHVTTFRDLYGHDSRLSAALTGRTLRPEPAAAETVATSTETKKRKKKTYQSPETLADVISGFWLN